MPKAGADYVHPPQLKIEVNMIYQFNKIRHQQQKVGIYPFFLLLSSIPCYLPLRAAACSEHTEGSSSVQGRNQLFPFTLCSALKLLHFFSFQVAQEYKDGPFGLYPGLFILCKTDEYISYFNQENHPFTDRHPDH